MDKNLPPVQAWFEQSPCNKKTSLEVAQVLRASLSFKNQCVATGRLLWETEPIRTTAFGVRRAKAALLKCVKAPPGNLLQPEANGPPPASGISAPVGRGSASRSHYNGCALPVTSRAQALQLCEDALPDTFNKSDIDIIYRISAAQRDVRHFVPGAVDEALLTRVLTAAHQAPSVGLMQPWRIIRIQSPLLREQICQLVDAERMATAAALGERGNAFMRIKVEAIRECGEVLVAALMDKREGHVFGRRTMPEMDLASVACAIQNMWLASRAEGLGMCWVSLFDPEKLAALLGIPDGAKPVAIICLGHVKVFYPKPMLEIEGWAQRGNLADMVSIDRWKFDPT